MNIGIIGTGNLGKAIIDCMIKNNINITASNRTPTTYRGIRITSDNKKTAEDSDIIILTVKPKSMEEVLKDIKDHTGGKLILTFAAGLKINYYIKRIHREAKFVRVMTNLAIKNSTGISAYTLSKTCTGKDKLAAEKILSYLGKHTEVKDERMLDVITGISGSAIAYFIRIMDIFQESGIKHGIDKKQSRKIIIETMKGSLSLMENTDQENSQLISQIASKGGTTQEGLKELQEKNMEEILNNTIEKTIEKCRTIGDKYE